MYIIVLYMVNLMRDVYTSIIIRDAEMAIRPGVAHMVQKPFYLPQSAKGLETVPGTPQKNNHKGYIGSSTNTVSYSV